MPITLNHTIIPSLDNVASAEFYERIFGFDFLGEYGHFAVVRVNETLSLDFATKVKENIKSTHYAFKVSEPEFDEIFKRLEVEEIKYGSGPDNSTDMKINHNCGGRGVYFRDPNNHMLEMLTVDYDLSTWDYKPPRNKKSR